MTSKSITRRFTTLRTLRHYGELGNFFFNVFMTQRQDAGRKTASRLWKSMSRRERNLCEGY